MARQRPSMHPVHESLRMLVKASDRIVATVPDETPRKGSLRARERQELIGTRGGGGRERAESHDRMNVDAMAYVVNTGVLVSGVADLFEIGVANEFNSQALEVLVRAPIEMAAQMAWLLDSDIDASERVRRYFMWRLSDINSQRSQVRSSRTDTEGDFEGIDLDALQIALSHVFEAMEAQVLDWVKASKWEAHERRTVGGNERAPALLDTSNPNGVRRLSVPKIGGLVRAATSSGAIYSMLSAPAHGRGWAGVDPLVESGKRTAGGQDQAKEGGSAFKLNVVKTLAIGAVALPTSMLAEWNGVDHTALTKPAKRIEDVWFTEG